MKRVLLVIGLVAVVFGQEAVIDESVAERTVTIPAYIKRPSLRYNPSRDIRVGDSIQIIVRFKANGNGNWLTTLNKLYSPNSIPDDKVLLFVLRANIEESAKVE